MKPENAATSLATGPTPTNELRRAFDPVHYLATYPDVAAAGMDPFFHYRRHGWKEGRDPAPWFNSLFYLAQAGLELGSVDPLSHFLSEGRAQGLRTTPEASSTEEAAVDPPARCDPGGVPEDQPVKDTAPGPSPHRQASPADRVSMRDGKFIRGNVDVVQDRTVFGWIFDPARPGHRLTVQVVSRGDGAVLAEGFASLLRPDLEEAGIGDGRHAFQIVVEVRPEAAIEVDLREAETGHILGQAVLEAAPPRPVLGAEGMLFEQLFARATGGRSPMFAPLTSRRAPVGPSDPRAIAFYLPQFHPFPENDLWWGRGFTEWTNVSKAVPQYQGHLQPRLPGELGYYDLRVPEVMARQIELARQFGLGGFCFHYYWFSGQRLLERPLDQFLDRQDAAFDFPFCLCWANENWTRRWDGAEHDVLMRQSHDRADHLAVFDDMLRYLRDPRYIRIGNRPVVVVYRPGIIDDLPALVEIWRRRAREEGFDDLFLIATNSFGFADPDSIGFDALCEFPPHNIVAPDTSRDRVLHNPSFEGRIYRYADARDYSLQRLEGMRGEPRARRHFPGVMMGWDNEARKPGRGHVFDGADPRAFHDWLLGALRFSAGAHDPEARLVFVNAWNEWGEGTYLEPDRWFGYGYLNAVAAAYDGLHRQPKAALAHPDRAAAAATREPAGVVILHAFYEDLLPEMAEAIRSPWIGDRFDVVATVPQDWDERQREAAADLLGARAVLATPNVGRDVLPFLEALRWIGPGRYDLALKIHTKKSPHLREGRRWREALLSSLTGEAEVAAVRGAMAADPLLGLMAPEAALMAYGRNETLLDNRAMLGRLIAEHGLSVDPDSAFVAGSMFWFRPGALAALADAPLDVDAFGPELGGIDGTLAHALERLLPAFVRRAGYRVAGYPSANGYNPYG